MDHVDQRYQVVAHADLAEYLLQAKLPKHPLASSLSSFSWQYLNAE
jgi:hypothetical protein